MKKIPLTFILALLVTAFVSASPRLTAQAEQSYPSPAVMQLYTLERIVLNPILNPVRYVVDTTHEFTKLSYGRAHRFFSPVKPENKIVDESILEKINSGDNAPILVDIEFYASPMKYEERILKYISSDLYIYLGNGVNSATATILPTDALKITSLPSVRRIFTHTYPTIDNYNKI